MKKIDGYDDEDGVGKFAAFCEDNGFDDDDDTFKEEFDAGPDQCAFCDIEDAFPWLEEDDESRNKKIYDLLYKCWSEKSAFTELAESMEPLKISKADWQVSEKDLQAARRQLREQCPTICNEQFLNDQALSMVISVGMKMGRPYLQWLVDMFTREGLYHHHRNKNGKNYPESEWAASNKHTKYLNSIKVKTNGKANTAKDLVVAAVSSFSKRISPSMMLRPPLKIQDSLRQISNYIAATVHFVAGLVANNKRSCPFQYDSVYAIESVKMKVNTVVLPMRDDDVDDDSDDDDEEDDSKTNDDNDDPFGALKEKMKANELPFLNTIIGDGSDSVKPARAFNDSFNAFKERKMKKLPEYPRNERFLSVVDRRKQNKSKGIVAEDELIFFAPPRDCRKLPHPPHPFYFFEASRTCIVPDREYTAKLLERLKQMDDGATLRGPEKAKTVTSMSLRKGIVLSFHCLSAEEIRCYIYIGSQGMRFLPEDIRLLLPIFFDENYADNKKWADSDEAKKLVKGMQQKLRDDEFIAFLKSYKSQKDVE